MNREFQSKLLLVEGLPSTGKSTNSGILHSQLEWNGYPVRWIHEVARPHPTLFFDEAYLTELDYIDFCAKHPHTIRLLERVKMPRGSSVAVDLLDLEWNHLLEFGQDAFSELKQFDVWNFPLERYMEVALEKWEHFVASQQMSDEIAILDSSVFQFQIYTFLLQNAPIEKLLDFTQRIFRVIEPLCPTLIYFYRENVEDTITCLEQERGVHFLERIWERDQHLPYYRNREPGVEGYKAFLRDYGKCAERLFKATPFRKIGVEITEAQWDKYVHQISSELALPYVDELKHDPPSGIFYNEHLDQYIQISKGNLVTPNGATKRLVPKAQNEFYIRDLPTVLKFTKDSIVMVGEQICERWTSNGTVFARINK